MEKIVFKNMYLNIIVGALIIIATLVAYFMDLIEDYLPMIVGIGLILLSIKRFGSTFKKTGNKKATFILVIELVLDFAFAGLLIYMKDHFELFVGLTIYVRGVSYLLINYIATREINVSQYLFNILYVTLGSFLMFYPLDTVTFIVLGLSIILFLLGAIFLQAGVTSLVKREKADDLIIQKVREEIELAEQEKQEANKVEDVEIKEEVIEEIEVVEPVINDSVIVVPIMEDEDLDETEETSIEVTDDDSEHEVEAEKQPVIDYKSKTVVELKAIAKKKNISGTSGLNKAALISKIKKGN